MFRSTLWVVGLSALLLRPALGNDLPTRWTMLNVTPHNDVADCHLIELPDGSNILIDAGKLADTPAAVIGQLRTRQITRIDLAVISHFHVDHYGALLELIESGIQIKKVAVNVPDKTSADREKPWGCDFEHVRATLESLRSQGIPWFTPKIGERLYETTTASGALISLEALSLYDGLNTPIGPSDVNDTSMILRLSHGTTRALFTGDLNHSMGSYLATTYPDLKADLLKVPHHGTESTVPNSFFDRVGAKAVLVPSPKKLWESARSMRIRNYFLERHVPAYVSGLHGHVTTYLTVDGYRIESER